MKLKMTSESILIRDHDKKSFKVKIVSHWSLVVSDDGEFDTVKYMGGYVYVSMSKGFGYILQEE
jgi:hypothetical protein